ncbi:hypothetical protein BJ912DRAFT_1039377 [Pholiota molesta]|nr:hypothetical protein BJ912DRAFT_1039377 [Pholiota molesta]
MIRNAIAAFDEIDDDRPPAGIYGRSRLADSRMGWAQRDVGGSGLDTARARICARESGAAGRCGRAAKALCHSGRLHPPILPLFDASPADEPALSWPHPMCVDHPPGCSHTTTMPPQPTMSSGGTRTPPPARHVMPRCPHTTPATTSFRGAQDDGLAPAPRHPAHTNTPARPPRARHVVPRCPHTTTMATHRPPRRPVAHKTTAPHPRHVIPRRMRCGWNADATATSPMRGAYLVLAPSTPTHPHSPSTRSALCGYRRRHRECHPNRPPPTSTPQTGPGDCSMNATDQFVEAMGLHSLAIDDADFADGMMESMDCMINQVPLVEVVWCWAIGREMRDRTSYHPILNKEMHSKASIGSTIEMA